MEGGGGGGGGARGARDAGLEPNEGSFSVVAGSGMAAGGALMREEDCGGGYFETCSRLCFAATLGALQRCCGF